MRVTFLIDDMLKLKMFVAAFHVDAYCINIVIMRKYFIYETFMFRYFLLSKFE